MLPIIVGNREEETECTELCGKPLTWAGLMFLYDTRDETGPPAYVLTTGKRTYIVKLAYIISFFLIFSGFLQ